MTMEQLSTFEEPPECPLLIMYAMWKGETPIEMQMSALDSAPVPSKEICDELSKCLASSHEGECKSIELLDLGSGQRYNVDRNALRYWYAVHAAHEYHELCKAGWIWLWRICHFRDTVNTLWIWRLTL